MWVSVAPLACLLEGGAVRNDGAFWRNVKESNVRVYL
jgi:hypothetical protein